MVFWSGLFAGIGWGGRIGEFAAERDDLDDLAGTVTNGGDRFFLVVGSAIFAMVEVLAAEGSAFEGGEPVAARVVRRADFVAEDIVVLADELG